jgi:predicted transcriptional regulator
MTEISDRILAATMQIVTAWVEATAAPSDAFPRLIRDVHQTLRRLEQQSSALTQPETRPDGPRSAVDRRKSVFRDHLVCLEDGKSMVMLRRHLRTEHGLTPEAYRAKWDLPASYPMVAPDYAKVRGRLAKESRLGHRSRSTGI